MRDVKYYENIQKNPDKSIDIWRHFDNDFDNDNILFSSVAVRNSLGVHKSH